MCLLLLNLLLNHFVWTTVIFFTESSCLFNCYILHRINLNMLSLLLYFGLSFVVLIINIKLFTGSNSSWCCPIDCCSYYNLLHVQVCHIFFIVIRLRVLTYDCNQTLEPSLQKLEKVTEKLNRKFCGSLGKRSRRTVIFWFKNILKCKKIIHL